MHESQDMAEALKRRRAKGVDIKVLVAPMEQGEQGEQAVEPQVMEPAEAADQSDEMKDTAPEAPPQKVADGPGFGELLGSANAPGLRGRALAMRKELSEKK